MAGAGALGSWIGAELAASGAETLWVARGAQGAAIAEGGLRVEREGRPAFTVRPTIVSRVSEAADRGPFDLVLVTVKSYATAGLAEELSRLGPLPCLLSLQNGLGNEAELAERLPDSRVCAGSVTAACSLLAPGRVRAGAKGGLAYAGPDCGLDALAARLEARGLPTRRYADAAAMKWSKLLLNMLGAASCAVLGWPPARVFENPALFAVERAAWREALDVMEALGLPALGLPGYPVGLYAALARRLPEAWLFRLMAPRLARGRGERLPGPAADLAAGKPRTEIEWLNGAVARAGASVARPVPVNTALNRLVADLAIGRADRRAFAGRPEALLAYLSDAEIRT